MNKNYFFKKEGGNVNTQNGLKEDKDANNSLSTTGRSMLFTIISRKIKANSVSIIIWFVTKSAYPPSW